MDINTLKDLGITPETLAERIVEQAVNTMLDSVGFDPETEREVSFASRFQKEVNDRLKKAVDAKISELATVHLIPKVGELIEKADMRKTNRYGEPQSQSMTFKEYIASRAENYMSEEVDFHGRSKEEAEAKGDGYNWRSCGPRLTVAMKMYIKDAMEKCAKEAVNSVNEALAKGITKAAQDAISGASKAAKVTVTV